MTVDMFIAPLIGGILIGLAASGLLLFKGRIFGITGIVAGSLTTNAKEGGWRWAILLGLMTGSMFMSFINPTYFDYDFIGGPVQMGLAGLIVGFGTRLGSGCTSGHGVCGLARFSMRSLAATLTFMLFGIITVWFVGGM